MKASLGTSTRPELVMEKARRNSANSLLQFPSDLSAQCILFIFKKYEYKKPGDRGGLLKNGSSIIGTASPTSSILLPIPTNLKENFSLNINGFAQGYFGSIMSEEAGVINKSLGSTSGWTDAVKTAFTNFTNSMADQVDAKTIIDTLSGQNNSSLAADANFLMRSQMSKDMQNNIDVGLGSTINPKQSLAFNGVELKSHNFSWTFAPKNRKESETLRDIGNLIKSKILPTYGNMASGTDKAFLNYPEVVDMYLLGVSEDYYLHFKTCMVKNFEVDYAGKGLSFLSGGKPTAVSMSMTLMEMDIHTAEDYQVVVSQASRNGF